MKELNDDTTDMYKAIYGTKARKITKLKNKIDEGERIFKNIDLKEKEFLASAPKPHGKFFLYGLLCAAAIIFDYVITFKTTALFDEFLPPSLLAFILSFIDLSVATLQAGTFSKTTAGKTIAKKQWRPILWGLGLIKILLFIILVYFIQPDEFELSTNWLLTIIELLLLVLVYVIFDFAGEGIYYIFNKFKFLFLKNIWYDDKEPDKVARKIKEAFYKFDLEISQNGHNKDDIYSFFNLK